MIAYLSELALELAITKSSNIEQIKQASPSKEACSHFYQNLYSSKSCFANRHTSGLFRAISYT